MKLCLDINKINKKVEIELEDIYALFEIGLRFYLTKNKRETLDICTQIQSREGEVIVYKSPHKKVLKIIECSKIMERFRECPLNIQYQELKWWFSNNIDIYFKKKYLKCPSLPKIYEISYLTAVKPVSICIYQEYCGEQTLYQYLKKTQLSLSLIKTILCQSISTILFLDKYNIYHNDINLSNLIITENCRKKGDKYTYHFQYNEKKYYYLNSSDIQLSLIDFTMATYKFPRNQYKYLWLDCEETMYADDVITLFVHILQYPTLPTNIYQILSEIVQNNVILTISKYKTFFIKNRNLEKIFNYLFGTQANIEL